MIVRSLLKRLEKRLSNSNKIIIVIGPRQCGKTTLIKSLLKEKQYLFLNGDDISVRQELSAINKQQLKLLLGSHKVVFIDEAQRIENIGLTLKLIHDEMSEIKLIVSGSSSFEIAQQTNEPLTGRKWEYRLFPISWQEYYNHIGYLDSKQLLEHRLIYGMYPDIINHPEDEEELLKTLADSYLYKDILTIADIRKPEAIMNLLKALAFQVGSEVSYNELSKTLGIDKNTVSNYIDLLEKAFVIFKLQPLSRNLRNEISTKRKIYFIDNGIRNAVISNFSPFKNRLDKGALWENFLVSERWKFNEYNRRNVNTYYWRTKTQQEVDYLEELNGEFDLYEFKWSSTKKIKWPNALIENYNTRNKEMIDQNTFVNFLINQ